ncbi:MAG: DNA gyrase inhibitor YacG [Alphaproteobacteria bacterium]|nr:DNA gyrase inhibitor YacG [Alphaproteobacteria bacterium]
MRSCAVCGKPAVEKFKPFCSGRCADIDLHRWLSESYTIPVKADESEDEGDEQSDEDK